MWFSALLLAALLAGCCDDDNGRHGHAKAIAAYSLAWGGAAPASATGVINETVSPGTITVAVPIGADVTALTATFLAPRAGVAIASTEQVSGVTVNDFTAPLVYTVTAHDGKSRTYIVTVTQTAYVDPLGTDDPAHGNGVGTAAFATIQYALGDSRVLAGNAIQVAPGTYTEVGQIVIDRNLTLIGADRATTIIKPAQDTGSVDDARGWFLVNPDVTFNIRNVTLDGTGRLVYMGLYYWGNGTVDNCAITNIRYNESGPDYQGRAIVSKGNVDVLNSTISGYGRIGIHYSGGDGTASGNTITGMGAGTGLNYGFDIGHGSVVAITDNVITDNLGTVETDSSGALLVTTYFAPGTTATITGNTVANNGIGIAVGFLVTDTSVVVAHDNSIVGNDTGIYSTQPVVDAENNWWGDASGPYHAALNPTGTGNDAGDFIDFSPWLVTAP